jgi:hypothetical protein
MDFPCCLVLSYTDYHTGHIKSTRILIFCDQPVHYVLSGKTALQAASPNCYKTRRYLTYFNLTYFFNQISTTCFLFLPNQTYTNFTYSHNVFSEHLKLFPVGKTRIPTRTAVQNLNQVHCTFFSI